MLLLFLFSTSLKLGGQSGEQAGGGGSGGVGGGKGVIFSNWNGESEMWPTEPYKE